MKVTIKESLLDLKSAVVGFYKNEEHGTLDKVAGTFMFMMMTLPVIAIGVILGHLLLSPEINIVAKVTLCAVVVVMPFGVHHLNKFFNRFSV